MKLPLFSALLIHSLMVFRARAKSDEELKKYNEFDRQYWYERNRKFNVKHKGWTDGTGKLYYLMEFESYDAFGKYMDDEGLQRYWQENCRLIHNIEMKVLREYI